MINLGIVGLGHWGRRHAESALASGRFRVVRAVARHPDAVADFARTRSIDLSPALEELLADPRVQAVSIATPHSMHAAQVIQAANAGKHVRAEKPFALSKADAEAAVAACAKAGVVVAVGHDNRFYPAVEEIRRTVESGEIGAPLHVEANLSHDHTKLEAQRAAVGGGGKVSPREAWRLHRDEAPGGSIVHLGVHRIDTFVQLFGRIDRVFAQEGRRVLDTPFADSVCAQFRFRNGMTGCLSSSLATPLHSHLNLYGTGGWILASGPGDPAQYRRGNLRSLRIRSGAEVRTRECEGIDSVKECFAAFAGAVEGTKAPAIPREEIIHVVEVLEALTQSLLSGQPVAL
ncbi:MAG: Gfo/Idh/MocA family oxidoreductase [Burkholderiales bacterium]|nr:Gfo/Idh/MocA family oxidoreductase [Burkholderiales bacterium]